MTAKKSNDSSYGYKTDRISASSDDQIRWWSECDKCKTSFAVLDTKATSVDCLLCSNKNDIPERLCATAVLIQNGSYIVQLRGGGQVI